METKMQTMVKPDGLPCDVMFDIFSRLPAKSLSRFRCVSSSFLETFATPYFKYLRYQNSSKNHPFSVSLSLLELDAKVYRHARGSNLEVGQHILLSTLDHEGGTISEFIKEIQIDGWKEIFVLPSHHNLICIVTINHIYVCNPSNQEFVELPKGSNFRSMSNMVGFGYIPSKNEYKVVRSFFQTIGEDDSDLELGCEVLTISNNYGTTNIIESCSAWRVLEEGCPHLMEDVTKPAFVNGSVHWKINPFWFRRGEGEEIMSFNLEKEKFWILPAPECVKICPESVKLVELNGNLWLTHFDETRPYVMDMWVLKDFDKFSWIKEHSIDLSMIMKRFGNEETTFVMNIRDEELLIRMGRNRQAYFNTTTKTLTDFGSQDNRFQFCYFKYVASFH